MVCTRLRLASPIADRHCPPRSLAGWEPGLMGQLLQGISVDMAKGFEVFGSWLASNVATQTNLSQFLTRPIPCQQHVRCVQFPPKLPCPRFADMNWLVQQALAVASLRAWIRGGVVAAPPAHDSRAVQVLATAAHGPAAVYLRRYSLRSLCLRSAKKQRIF